MEPYNALVTDLRPVLMALIDLGMRQSEIAREIGLSRATINFAVKKSEGGWMPGYLAGSRLVNLLETRRKELISDSSSKETKQGGAHA